MKVVFCWLSVVLVLLFSTGFAFASELPEPPEPPPSTSDVVSDDLPDGFPDYDFDQPVGQPLGLSSLDNTLPADFDLVSAFRQLNTIGILIFGELGVVVVWLFCKR